MSGVPVNHPSHNGPDSSPDRTFRRVLWNQIIKEALRRPSEPAAETGKFGTGPRVTAKALSHADRDGRTMAICRF